MPLQSTIRRATILWAAVFAVVLFCIWELERERRTVSSAEIITPEGPVTLYQAPDSATGPLVIVTHGFAGSRQMMQYISRDLARAGFTVAAFDFYGQGRNQQRMSADVTRIEGTTQQLIEQTESITTALRDHLEYDGPIALVGHSMATDIIIRAAQDMRDVAAIVAISMYSDAVTAQYPKRLLIISGEWEDRLRAVGRDLMAQVDEDVAEGDTVLREGVMRRAVYVPRTEHVAVLFASQTQREIRNWLLDAFEVSAASPVKGQGPAILGVLIGICFLFWPLSQAMPKPRIQAQPVDLKVYFAALLLPVLPAVLAAAWAPGSVLATASFAALAAFFGVWAVISLGVLVWARVPLRRPFVGGFAMLLFWGLAVFAVALDRYAAAFLPTGPRLGLMLVLALGTVPFMLADRLLLTQARLWQRMLARVVPVAALAGAMVLVPGDLGLSFTVLPVMVLFYLVFGTMGRAVAQRCGPETAGLALGLILAWSIAASTPLFAG